MMTRIIIGLTTVNYARKFNNDSSLNCAAFQQQQGQAGFAKGTLWQQKSIRARETIIRGNIVKNKKETTRH
jgi:hypothetical protein